MLISDKTYKAAAYLRLSKEDGDFSVNKEEKAGGKSSRFKQESNSISGQRALIQQFAQRTPDVEIVGEYCDDGFTGTNFNRPDFKRLMADIKDGKINCVIVKDLSRLGRDYIDTGRYLEKEFPKLGVRFIAITDHYDSQGERGGNDGLIIPFKNLMNDNYARDISGKVRSTQSVKRQRGEFIANFTVYGYLRDETDKNKLIVDDYPASVVRDIFAWYIAGKSSDKIADLLNRRGDPCPAEYKQSIGSNYTTTFKRKTKSRWSAVAVLRILTNEIYTGVMVQGRRTSINHKLKKAYYKDESEWDRVPNTHEAIISHALFDLVQNLIAENTRSTPDGDVLPLSGKVYCGTCGQPAKRQTVCSRGRYYVYHVCPDCPGHRMSEPELMQTVLEVLQAEIKTTLDIDETLKRSDALLWEKREIRKLDAHIAVQQEIIDKNNRLKMGVYEDLRDGIIEKEDFSQLRQEFDQRIKDAEAAIKELEKDRRNVADGLQTQKGWLAQFRKYKNLQELNRTVVVNLIEGIYIHPGKRLDVRVRHKNHFAGLRSFYQEQQAEQGQSVRKEAM